MARSDNKKNDPNRMLTASVAVAAAALLALTALPAALAAAPAKKEGGSDTYRQLNLFGDVFERVRAEYVEEVTDEKLIEHALNGMLTNLDPHSGYMNEEDYKNMQVQTKGEFGGLGIEVTMENGLVKVVSPIDDTPAFKAGIQAGDFITHLDGEQVMGMTLNDAVKKMRGRVGTPIELTIHRAKLEKPLKVKIVRDLIQIKSVRHRVEANTGYIRITTFNQQTQPGLEKAVKDIQKELGGKLIGYVLDLRNNPGGLLDQAISVSDSFLDKGEIVSTRGRNPEDTRRDNAAPGDLTQGLPVVVLINGGSASASEIVAGALQDHRRGIVMGTKSFGKGSVQTVITLPGHGAIRLTTARYYTPSGRSIQAKGIEPDIVVEPAKVEELENEELLREADLRGALDAAPGSTPGTSPAPQAAPSSTDGTTAPAGTNPEDDTSKSLAARDYQLARAVDLLQGLSLYRGFGNGKN